MVERVRWNRYSHTCIPATYLVLGVRRLHRERPLPTLGKIHDIGYVYQLLQRVAV